MYICIVLRHDYEERGVLWWMFISAYSGSCIIWRMAFMVGDGDQTGCFSSNFTRNMTGVKKYYPIKNGWARTV